MQKYLSGLLSVIILNTLIEVSYKCQRYESYRVAFDGGCLFSDLQDSEIFLWGSHTSSQPGWELVSAQLYWWIILFLAAW